MDSFGSCFGSEQRLLGLKIESIALEEIQAVAVVQSSEKDWPTMTGNQGGGQHLLLLQHINQASNSLPFGGFVSS